MLNESSWKILYDYGGLSEYEARVYTALVMTGASNARKISAVCGVPRTKVYKVLRGLIEKGFVIEIPSIPAIFAPVSPLEAFKSLIEAYEARTRSLVEAVNSLERFYRENRENMGLNRSEVWILKNRRRILKKIEEMISSVKYSLTLTTTENGLILFYKLFNRHLDKLISRNVKVTINVSVGRKIVSVLRELQYICEVKQLVKLPPILFLNVDGRKTLLSYRIPDDYDLKSDMDICFFSEDKSLCEILSMILCQP